MVAHRFRSLEFALCFSLGFASVTNAQELLFPSIKESQRILSAKDAFIERMSPFDRAARMKTDRETSELQFLNFVSSSAMEWESYEKVIINSAFQKIRRKIARLALPLPSRVYLIKTSGKEEGSAPYTRANAIVLPKSIFASNEREIQRLLAHELFHISSRAHPKLAKVLYESIGFHFCGEVEFPKNLLPIKITNPDAPKNEHCIQIDLGGQKVWAVPILFSRIKKYDTSRGGEFFQYLDFAFLLVPPPGEGNIGKPIYDSRGSRLIRLEETTGFFDQVGQNTQYIIHPEEILADNFALLVIEEQHVRSPDVLKRIGIALKGFRPANSPNEAGRSKHPRS